MVNAVMLHGIPIFGATTMPNFSLQYDSFHRQYHTKILSKWQCALCLFQLISPCTNSHRNSKILVIIRVLACCIVWVFGDSLLGGWHWLSCVSFGHVWNQLDITSHIIMLIKHWKYMLWRPVMVNGQHNTYIDWFSTQLHIFCPEWL